jgi:hypothetical protein
MKASAVAATLGPALATAYAINHGPVHCHAGPGHFFPLVKTYGAGVDVYISCQTVDMRTSIWHKTSDGCYVAHRDVHTNDVAISRCDDAQREYYPADEL